MYLYLVQHAEAKREEEDPERGLTEKGMKDIKKVAEHVSALSISIETIFHSGKKRAHQTAQVLAEALRPERGIAAADGLAPNDDPQIWIARLKDVKDTIMLVSHLPLLSRLASRLLCGSPERNVIKFTMGGIVCLEKIDEEKWSVVWVITPELIH